jgi:hypothetical protein
MTGGDRSFKVKVKTLGMEKANTIAIYETNGTVFNGHYQTQERMNIIQLYVNDSGDGTPFEEGLNAIVIPTSLFTETVFNAHVQNETLNATAIYSADEDLFKFISVGRDGKTTQACEEIDFVIIRFDISSQDAMEILDLLLTCLVNETTNETAKTYSYVSTKHNGTTATMMNLPHSVLNLISWFCNFSNSDQGSKPKGFKDWVLAPLKALGAAIIGVFITIGMAFVELFTIMIDFFATILMDILPILGYILWLIIRVLLLIFIWIMFVITLLFLTIAIGVIALIYLPIVLLVDGEMQYTINSVKVVLPEFSLSIGYQINIEYHSYFEIWVPFLNIYCSLGNLTLFDLVVKYWPPSLDFESEDTSQPGSSGLSSSSLRINFPEISLIEERLPSIKSSSSEFDSDLFLGSIPEFFIGLDQAFGGWSVANSIVSISLAMPLDKDYVVYGFQIASMIIFITILISQIVLASYNKYEWFWFLIGSGIVSIVNGIYFYKAGKSNNHNWITSLGDDYLNALKTLHSKKEFLTDIFAKDMFPTIFTIVGSIYDQYELEVPESYTILSNLLTVLSIGASLMDWFQSFIIIRLASNLAMVQAKKYDERLKSYSKISVLIGGLLIILGTKILFPNLGEE